MGEEFLFGVYYSKKEKKEEERNKEINFPISVFYYKQEKDRPQSSWNKDV